MTQPIIEVRDLVVDYGTGARKTRAVNGVSFRVDAGECIGFIGPNGAGKSTTMKALLGFLFPTSGEVKVFGSDAGTVESRRRLGYLPEVTLYYPFMKARELLELYGGLQGLGKRALRDRIPGLLDEVGLGGKGEVLLRQFSKGMQQRLGIAQAIIADPELLIFDELSSGLDPVGRFDLREVLLRLKKAGRTIFFSSHELSEVESLCDRVIMINKGRVVTSASVEELMKPLNLFEVEFTLPAGVSLPAELSGIPLTTEAGATRAVVHGTDLFNRLLGAVMASGGTVKHTVTRVRSLEQYFIDLIRGTTEKP